MESPPPLPALTCFIIDVQVDLMSSCRLQRLTQQAVKALRAVQLQPCCSCGSSLGGGLLRGRRGGGGRGDTCAS